MENNYNLGSSALVVYIWMHHISKNIRHNSTFFNSKSATHETFVIGKFISRICHEFLMLLRGQTAGTLLGYLCHLFPKILLHVAVEILKLCLPLNLIWFFPPPAGLTGVFVWENYYFRPKALPALPPSIQSSHNRELHVHRHSQVISTATQRTALQSLYTINNTVDCQGCFHCQRVFNGLAVRAILMSLFSS